MKFKTDAMAAELTYHGIARVSRHLVHGSADVAEETPGLHCGKTRLHRFVCDVDQALPLWVDFADAEHA